MPSFMKTFPSVSGRSNVSLFEIRLDNDFVVFRGAEHESAGQTLKGSLVLCLSSPLKVEDIHLRLTGDLRLSWEYSKGVTAGLSTQRVEKREQLLKHRWAPFVKGGPGEKKVLEAGNYEWPFEVDMPGDTPESVEGISEARIVYRLKATIARGKLAHDIHAYKPVRVIRTLEPGALEFLHAMSVENIWPNKVDYSVVLPQKAVIFGATVPLEMRFTPLLKGLELGDITVRLIEIREATTGAVPARDFKYEREAKSWTFNVTREEHWSDVIGETGQEGWQLEKKLDLPRRLRHCVQDVNHHGIKIRHKLKLVVALKNPDNHISELRATLPVSIFLSPNMPLDEQGNLVESNDRTSAPEADTATMAPPGYGQHILDQLYEDVDMSGFQTPAFASGVNSGVNSPFYAQSRVGSSENLAALGMTSASTTNGVSPVVLSSRLQNMSLEPQERHSEPPSASTSNPHTATHSYSNSAALTRHNSAEDDGEDHQPQHGHHTPHINHARSGRASPEHLESVDMEMLSKVPSYTTALKTPARATMTPGAPGCETLPDYFTVLSNPATPVGGGSPTEETVTGCIEDQQPVESPSISTSPSRRPRITSWSRNNSSRNVLEQTPSNGSEDRRMHLIQGRDRML